MTHIIFLSLLGGCTPSGPRSLDNIWAIASGATRINYLLNYPDSYEFEWATITVTYEDHNEYGKVFITHKVKNVSGEYTSRGAECKIYIQNWSPFINKDYFNIFILYIQGFLNMD